MIPSQPLHPLFRLLNIRAEEGRLVSLLMVYSLLMGGAIGMFYTCTTSLFLTKFASRQLPWVFVAGGVVVYTLGLGMRGLRRRVSTVHITNYLITFLLVSVAALALAGELTSSPWPYFLLMLWQRVFVFVHSITFWGTASRVFNLEQAKRLLSLIGTGEVIASMLSYFSVPLLLRFMSVDKLLVLALIFLVLCVGLLRYITGEFRHLLTSAPAPVAPAAAPSAAPVPAAPTGVSKTYQSQLYWLALLPVFGLLYIDYMFSVLSKEIYPTKENLATFLGFFFGICSVIELVVKVFLYQRLMKAYSVRFGVLLLPVALLVIFVLKVLYGTVVGVTSMFFALVALSRLFMSPLRRSISEPAFQLLFQPIPTAERSRLLARIEGGPKALGVLLPGVLLLALYAMGVRSMVELSGLFLLPLVLWVVIAFRVPAEYRAMLGAAIARSATAMLHQVTAAQATGPAVPANPTAMASSQSFEALSQLVSSPVANDRIRAAAGLGASGRFYAYRHLLALLTDPVPAVREAAINAAGVLRKQELWPRLFQYLGTAEHGASAKAALLAVGEPVIPALGRFFSHAALSGREQAQVVAVVNRIGGDEARRFLRAHLNHPSQLVREQVVAGLARLHHRATSIERPPLLRQLDDATALLVWLAAARFDLAEYDAESALQQALEEENLRLVAQVFNLLSIAYGNNQFDVISELITQKNQEIQPFLLELLSNILPAEVKNNILPLFTDVPLAEKVQLSAARYPQQQLGTEARLHDIINKDYAKLRPYTKAVALRELLVWHRADPTAILVANAVAQEAVIAETALAVLHTLNPARFEALHQAWTTQPDSVEFQLAERIAAGLPENDLLIHQSVPASGEPVIV